MPSLYDVLQRKRDPLAIPGFAGGTLSGQLNRQPPVRVAFGNNGLSGLGDENPKPPSLSLPPATPPDAAPAERNPYEGYTPERAAPPTPNIRIGSSTAGLDPLERQMAVLQSEQQAASDFPSSKVSSTGEILPPH